MSASTCVLYPYRNPKGVITTWMWVPPGYPNHQPYVGCVHPTKTVDGKKGTVAAPRPSSESGYSDPSAGGSKEHICYPETQAVPGTPALPPTESEMFLARNKGWNSHARSAMALPDGAQFEFHIDSGSEGVFVGLGPVGLDGYPLSAFAHGMMFTIHGVHVFEAGVEGALIASSFTGETVMTIARNGTDVTYSVGATDVVSGTEILDTDELVAYVYMYSAGDGILCAEFSASDVPSNSGDGAMSGSLPPLEAHLVYETGLTFLSSTLPPLYGGLAETYVPPVPVTMVGSLPPISGTGFMLASKPGAIDGGLPPLEMIAGDRQYGVLRVELAPLWASMYMGTRLDMDMFSYMFMVPMEDFYALQIMVMMEGMQITSVQAVTRTMVQQMIEELQVSGTMSMLGEYALSMNDVLGLRQYFTQTVGNQPSFDADSRVWVLNTDTAATVQFDNYAFNSYFNHNGEDYGVADNGIYRLGGDDDAGDAIQAEIQLGATLFGAGEHKRLPAIYVNASSDGKLIVKISVDGEDPWYYEARSSSDKLSKHRVDPGKGLMGTNWTFTLLNQDGDDFELADLTFIPLTGSRRI